MPTNETSSRVIWNAFLYIVYHSLFFLLKLRSPKNKTVSMRQWIKFEKCCNFWFDSLRQGAATVLNKQQDISQDQRIEFVPVEWRSSLKLDEGNTSLKGAHATPTPLALVTPSKFSLSPPLSSIFSFPNACAYFVHILLTRKQNICIH